MFFNPKLSLGSSDEVSSIKDVKAEAINYKEKVKRLFASASTNFYPVRPLFSLLIGLLISLFGFLHFPSAHFIFISGIGTIADDILLAPGIQIHSYIRNFLLGRKLLKSSLGLTLIFGMAIAAGFVGFFVLTHVPAMLAVTQTVMSTLGTSIVLFSVTIAAAALLSKLLRQSMMIGGLIGVYVAHYALPMVMTSLPLNLTVCAVLVTTFIATIVAKQSLRLIYKLAYGHSNADGYYFLLGNAKGSVGRRAELANYYGVTVSVFDRFIAALTRLPQVISAKSSFIENFVGNKTQFSSAYKDVLYLVAQDPKYESKEERELLIKDQFALAVPPEYNNNNRFLSYLAHSSKHHGIFSPTPQGVAYARLGNACVDYQANCMTQGFQRWISPMWRSTVSHEWHYNYRATWFSFSLQNGFAFFDGKGKVAGVEVESRDRMILEFSEATEAMGFIPKAPSAPFLCSSLN